MNVGRDSGHGFGPAGENERLVLAVIGGTSVGTPALIGALARAVQAGRLPRLDLRLHGRALERGRAVIGYASTVLSGVGIDATAPVRLRLEGRLREALADCDAIVCQVRAGGMAGRAGDEAMALAAGVPADEGLGPAGLANYLRSRPLFDRIGETWSSVAPSAMLFQLSSPLGLTVARVARHGRRVVGLCELPATTSRSVQKAVEPALGVLHHAHFGLNHCSWLYDFRDANGHNRTSEVIDLVADSLPVNAAAVRAEAAIPVAYLRLFYQRGAVLAEQRARGRTRGAEVLAWTEALDAAYRRRKGPDHAVITEMLEQRRMDWHEEAVVPALAAWVGSAPAEIVMNVTGAVEDIAVELPCHVECGVVVPLPQPPLPVGPQGLHCGLASYERAVLALADEPDEDEIAEVLTRHPLVPNAATASRLGREILARMDDCR